MLSTHYILHAQRVACGISQGSFTSALLRPPAHLRQTRSSPSATSCSRRPFLLSVPTRPRCTRCTYLPSHAPPFPPLSRRNRCVAVCACGAVYSSTFPHARWYVLQRSADVIRLSFGMPSCPASLCRRVALTPRPNSEHLPVSSDRRLPNSRVRTPHSTRTRTRTRTRTPSNKQTKEGTKERRNEVPTQQRRKDGRNERTKERTNEGTNEGTTATHRRSTSTNRA